MTIVIPLSLFINLILCIQRLITYKMYSLFMSLRITQSRNNIKIIVFINVYINKFLDTNSYIKG